MNRKALVSRHNPVIQQPDSLAPLSVGNGEFAFTSDVTGLQSFPDDYESGIPLGTQSHWGWHTIPNDQNFRLKDAMQGYDTYGRQVEYASMRSTPAVNWLRANPHRLHLGRIGLNLTKKDGSAVQLSDLTQTRQQLNLWTGRLSSSFRLEEQSVQVTTACHPERDLLAVCIESPLLETGQVDVTLHFPYGSESWGKTMADWLQPDRHQTQLQAKTAHSAILKRTLDETEYFVRLQWSPEGELVQSEPHKFHLKAGSAKRFEFVCHFTEQMSDDTLPTVAETCDHSAAHWESFWNTGGAIDLSGSSDPRAHELERRIVLSQYLTAIQCAGSFPPQETGLTCNSWYGKFHLEMHWWHAVQFALWGREHLLEKCMSWYQMILPMARETAARQGYTGARWHKMVGPDGREGPSSVAVFLIWQQPHPIYYAELLYRIHPNPYVLEKYRDLVFESAEFMASYAHWDDANQRYVLGPPLMPAQEKFPVEHTMNPAFELAYWAFGLEIAQKWRERLGMERHQSWDHVLKHLSQLPVKDSLYVNTETAPNTFEPQGERRDHPTVLAVYGMLPGKTADPEIARNTLKAVMQSWHWEHTWGWDYALTAMTAARLGEPELAIDALLMDQPKNRYLINGHNFQNDRLPIYLPGNGSLLTAAAMMAAGWEGAPENDAPGFPKNGKWIVRHEGLRRLP
ncbi:glycoside hydrolase family 65 [candidate division KSB1 bacterium]|nr:glycoside hydrolase family 65 [candidate division KSB1 bacterium]